jgi:hypothetical protein
MEMRKRFIIVVAGGCALLVVLAIGLLLVQSTRSSMVAKQSEPVHMREMAMPAPPPANVASPSRSYAPTMAVSEPPALSSPRQEGSAETTLSTDPIQVSAPQLAYAYMLAYRLPGPKIADAQQAHLTLCERLGSTQCQLVSLRHGSSDEGYRDANLQLRVASGVAQRFRADLTKAISAAGGRPVDTNITAEDVSKDVSDTEARIRQREILVARLTDMLRNRNGRVSELVEAERSVAGAQEELDQAKGWLRQLRTRVALSQFTINYVPAVAVEPSPQPRASRLSDAIVASAGVVYAVGRNLLILLIFLTPWALIGLAIFLPVHRWYRRKPLATGEA